MASDRGERKCAYPAAPVGRALQPVVVEQNRLAVGGEPDIELDPTATQRLCLAQSGKSVFRRICGGAAMSDDRRQDNFDPPALRRNSGRGGQQMPRRRCDIRGKFAAVPPGIGRRQVAAFTCCSWRSGRREPTSSPVSWSTWRMLSLPLPRSSKPSALTLTLSPGLTTAAPLPTRCGASSLM